MAEDATEEDLTGAIGAEPVCRSCGTSDVVRDAWAAWNPTTGEWELSQVFDDGYCNQCEQTTNFFRWQRAALSRTETIRALNDALRRTFHGGRIVMTDGVVNRGAGFINAVSQAVKTFDDFTPDNDPHQEHDFGALEVEDERVFFKIDYYDKDLQWHTPDATDPNVTTRVLTILLASEY